MLHERSRENPSFPAHADKIKTAAFLLSSPFREDAKERGGKLLREVPAQRRIPFAEDTNGTDAQRSDADTAAFRLFTLFLYGYEP
jgi:hypothetical protein